MDLEDKLIEHIGDRLKALGKQKSSNSRLQKAKELSARQELKEILLVIQKYHEENNDFMCEVKKGNLCSTRDYGQNEYKDACYKCCIGCSGAINMSCSFVCNKIAEHYYSSEE